MNYLQHRYLQNQRGQFISQDPMFWALPAQLLMDPQQQNSYSYARNNPISMSDPTGLLTMVVGGTKKNSKTDDLSSKAGKEFLDKVSKHFKETAVPFKWSGENSKIARELAAQELAAYINSYNFAPGEKLNIVGYSHGGNVAIRASNLKLNHNINNLVTLGTPVRSDYRPNYSKIDNHTHVYSKNDAWQRVGGGQMSASQMIGSSLFGPLGSQVGSYLGIGDFGVAGRTYSGATNIDVTNLAGNSPTASHGNLWKDSTITNLYTP